MNFAIHTIMYGYYSLKALRINIPRLISVLITSGQIAQMILGFYINSHIMVAGLAGTAACHCSKRASVAGFALYAIFFYFFVRLFVDNYLRAPTSTKTISERKGLSANIHKFHDLNNNLNLNLVAKKSS